MGRSISKRINNINWKGIFCGYSDCKTDDEKCATITCFPCFLITNTLSIIGTMIYTVIDDCWSMTGAVCYRVLCKNKNNEDEEDNVKVENKKIPVKILDIVGAEINTKA
jgi:hypothetical protein